MIFNAIQFHETFMLGDNYFDYYLGKAFIFFPCKLELLLYKLKLG